MLTALQTEELERALEPRYGRVRVAATSPVGGGCISTTLQVRLGGGPSVFVKLAPEGAPGDALLAAEAASLAKLREAGQVRVPAVLARGDGWLALEWLESGAASSGAWERLGEGLARLHRAGPADGQCGWPADNFIGNLPQANAAGRDWPAFWREQRLQPQLARALAAGVLGRGEEAAFGKLFERLPGLLATGDQDAPSLLHGDLWNGNVHITADGEAALIDPASYYGHREVDLAMAALFGGFPNEFYRAYAAAWPLVQPGAAQRRSCYQLYYLLVHVNLFGRGYVAGTMEALRRALG